MTKTFNVKEFEAFCRSKPGRETYDAGNSHTCALAQFGFPGIKWADVRDGEDGIPLDVYAALLGPNTFRALADRLSRLEAEGK